jgi:hypothetical protein
VQIKPLEVKYKSVEVLKREVLKKLEADAGVQRFQVHDTTVYHFDLDFRRRRISKAHGLFLSCWTASKSERPFVTMQSN